MQPLSNGVIWEGKQKVKNICWYIMHSVASKEFLFNSARYEGMQITKNKKKQSFKNLYIYTKTVFPSVCFNEKYPI